jgi:hypothetical protein
MVMAVARPVELDGRVELVTEIVDVAADRSAVLPRQLRFVEPHRSMHASTLDARRWATVLPFNAWWGALPRPLPFVHAPVSIQPSWAESHVLQQRLSPDNKDVETVSLTF